MTNSEVTPLDVIAAMVKHIEAQNAALADCEARLRLTEEALREIEDLARDGSPIQGIARAALAASPGRVDGPEDVLGGTVPVPAVERDEA